jgi:hypothetical protein
MGGRADDKAGDVGVLFLEGSKSRKMRRDDVGGILDFKSARVEEKFDKVSLW